MLQANTAHPQGPEYLNQMLKSSIRSPPAGVVISSPTYPEGDAPGPLLCLIGGLTAKAEQSNAS